MGEGLWAVVPVKSFSEAKSRLRDVIPEARRAGLARRLLSHTLEVLGESMPPERTLVVSRDEDALRLAADKGVQVLIESGAGLNAALEEAADHVLRRGAGGLLVLASDLPLLAPADLEDLLRPFSPPQVTIAPDRAGTGTNALLLQPPGLIPFAFGPDSYALHLRQAEALGLNVRSVLSEGLGFDLDHPDDLDELRRRVGEEWFGARLESVET